MSHASVTIEATAGAKILLHAIKYPHASINGVLLGTVSRASLGSPPVSPRGASGEGAGPLRITVTDAMPVTHTNLALSMPLDMALHQLDIYCSSHPGLSIVGYYQCNDRLGDTEFGAIARKVGDVLHARSPAKCSVGIMVNAAKMEAFYGNQDPAGVFEAYIKDGPKGWARAMPSSSSGPSLSVPAVLPGVLLKFMGEGRQHTIADFEEHMDDLERDWLNQGIRA